jgi:hypothetical protein
LVTGRVSALRCFWQTWNRQESIVFNVQVGGGYSEFQA